MLVAPRAHALLRLFRITRAVRRELVLDHAEEPVLGADHVQGHVAERPLSLSRYAVEIVIAYACERAGQIAIGVVVLAEDALGLARPRGSHRGEPHREIAELVLRHQKREPKSRC